MRKIILVVLFLTLCTSCAKKDADFGKLPQKLVTKLDSAEQLSEVGTVVRIDTSDAYLKKAGLEMVGVQLSKDRKTGFEFYACLSSTTLGLKLGDHVLLASVATYRSPSNTREIVLVATPLDQTQ